MRRLTSYLLLASCIYCAAPAFASDITDSAGLGSPGSTNYSQVPVDWANIRNKPPTATRWPTWNEIRNEYGRLPIDLINAPDGFLPAEHDHDDRYLRRTGGTMSGQLTMNHHLRINSSTLRISQGHFRATFNSKKDLEDKNHPIFMEVQYNNYVPDGHGMPNRILLRSNDYYGRPRTGVLTFQRNNRDENGERLYPALAGNPGGDVHLGEIEGHAWDEDAPPMLDGNGETITAYHRNAVGILFKTDGAWTDESKGTKIDFYTRPKNPEEGNKRRLRINSNGGVTIGGSSSVPTHQLYLRGATEEGVSDGIRIQNSLFLGETGRSAEGADIRTAGAFHLWSELQQYFSSGQGHFIFLHSDRFGDFYGVDEDTEILRITSSGNIRTYGSIINPSDERLKEDIRPLSVSLDALMEIKPVTYRWKNRPPGFPEDAREIGFVAQNVKEVFPELVRKEEDTGYLSVNYIRMVPPLVGAVNELNSRTAALQQDQEAAHSATVSRIAELEQRILELEAMLEQALSSTASQ